MRGKVAKKLRHQAARVPVDMIPWYEGLSTEQRVAFHRHIYKSLKRRYRHFGG